MHRVLPFLLPRFEGPGKEVSVERDSVRCRERLGFTMGVVMTGTSVSTRERLTISGAEVVYDTVGGVVCVVMFSAAPVTAVEFAWYPSDADLSVASQTHQCQASDLDQQPEIPGPSTREAH